MTTYVYLSARITVDENNIIITSNTCTKQVGTKVDPSYLKAVGYKKLLKDGRRTAIKLGA